MRIPLLGPRRCPEPRCRELAASGDRYCERCGAELERGVPAAAGLLPVRSCPRCGAGLARDHGGVCDRCGLRGAGATRDHVEVSLPALAGVSDRGRRHDRNEDAMALAAVAGHDARVLVVCDGVSSCEGADEAARVAADSVLAQLVECVQRERRDAEAAMREAAAAAQRAVCAVPHVPGGMDPPSTAFVAALVRDGAATIGWLGDCRAYLLEPPGDVRQLSRDHSWATEQVSLGLMEERQAATDPRAHMLTRWLGEDDSVTPVPSVATVPVSDRARLLLCSDGLWNYTPTPVQLAQVVAELPGDAPPLAIARHLTRYASIRGGHDNITVVVANG